MLKSLRGSSVTKDPSAVAQLKQFFTNKGEEQFTPGRKKSELESPASDVFEDVFADGINVLNE
jgi:hypothetical protein